MRPGPKFLQPILGLSRSASQQLLCLFILPLPVLRETLDVVEDGKAAGLTEREVWLSIALIRFFDEGASVDGSVAQPAPIILHFWAERVHFQQSEQQGRHAQVGDGVARSQALFDGLEKPMAFLFGEGSPERLGCTVSEIAFWL